MADWGEYFGTEDPEEIDDLLYKECMEAARQAEEDFWNPEPEDEDE